MKNTTVKFKDVIVQRFQIPGQTRMLYQVYEKTHPTARQSDPRNGILAHWTVCYFPDLAGQQLFGKLGARRPTAELTQLPSTTKAQSEIYFAEHRRWKQDQHKEAEAIIHAAFPETLATQIDEFGHISLPV